MEVTGTGAGVLVVSCGGGEPGDATVTLIASLLPSHTAVVVIVPGATALSNPLVSTVAIPAFDVLQVTTRFRSVSPRGPSTAAASWVVAPLWVLSDVGLIETLATDCGFTCTRMSDILPSTLRRTSLVPRARPTTPPSPVSEATSGAEDTHCTECAVRSTGLPSLSTA